MMTIDEKWESGDGQTGTSPQNVYVYVVHGTEEDGADDGPTVQAWVGSQLNAVVDGLLILTIERERIGDYSWKITATYGLPGNGAATGGQEFEFSTVGGSQHISRGHQHISTSLAPGVTPPADDVPQAGYLNPALDGPDVGGVDIDYAGFQFNVVEYLSADAMTASYLHLLYMCTFTTNAVAFDRTIDGVPVSFDVGEVLYKGCTGSRRSVGDVELRHTFAAQPNRTGLTIGKITDVNVKGWEYMSVLSRMSIAQTSQASFSGPSPEMVLVDAVYLSENWTGLLGSIT